MGLKYYTETTDVYRYSGISSSIIGTTNVTEFIKEAEEEVDTVTQTTYWKENISSAITAGSTNTITTSGLTSGLYDNEFIEIITGTGAGQIRTISSNTTGTVTVTDNWTTVPGVGTFTIYHCGTDPFKNEVYDGDGQSITQVSEYPIVQVDELTIDDTSVTTSNLYIYSDDGQIRLKSTAEMTSFPAKYKTVDIDYWYGVKEVPLLIKKYTAITAAISTLQSQMGGSYNDVSAGAIGPLNYTVGQPYMVMKNTFEALTKEKTGLEKKLKKYIHMY